MDMVNIVEMGNFSDFLQKNISNFYKKKVWMGNFSNFHKKKYGWATFLIFTKKVWIGKFANFLQKRRNGKLS